ncbi:hypothetical protein EDB83DRAFT_2552742 [Lactarius deliciosus]|nr:hypothetical protein EDB83DRAFT_2552742 [Lactarius deliciosus]
MSSRRLPRNQTSHHQLLPQIYFLQVRSRRPVGVTVAPTSAPDLGAAAEDGGGQRPDLRKKMDALDTLSVNRENHAIAMATLDHPPQSPSLPSVLDSDVAVAVPSLRELNAERTRDHPPHPSHCQYDIV